MQDRSAGEEVNAMEKRNAVALKRRSVLSRQVPCPFALKLPKLRRADIRDKAEIGTGVRDFVEVRRSSCLPGLEWRKQSHTPSLQGRIWRAFEPPIATSQIVYSF